MATAAFPDTALPDTGRRNLITLAVMLGTFMTILDFDHRQCRAAAHAAQPGCCR
ncbi:MAG: hypothetical protein ACMVO5_01760 [Polymorphobacter sp.]|uniref:hypothetical protein n=1 Tax=Polymorphobacter sp. TaxID=1909290 RepID=UPI003A858D70